MALEVKKKEKETSQSLVRRFNKRLKQSGLLLRARKRSFRKRRKSRQLKKRAALRREEKRKEYKRREKLSQVIKRYRR
ncbi:MAG: hypothetical protein ACKKMV_00525 [Candidatus Nealsonbacteria bacterium]